MYNLAGRSDLEKHSFRASKTKKKQKVINHFDQHNNLFQGTLNKVAVKKSLPGSTGLPSIEAL